MKTLKDFDSEFGFNSGRFGNLMYDFKLTEDVASETQHVLSHLTDSLRQAAIDNIDEIMEKNKMEIMVDGSIRLLYPNYETAKELGRIYGLMEFFDLDVGDLK